MNEVEKAELATLFALFLEYHVDPNSYRDIDDLHQDYHFKFPKEWLDSIISEWEDRGLVHIARSHSGTSALLVRARYTSALKHILAWLGGTSLTVDAKKEEILSDANPPSNVPMRSGWKWFSYQSDGQAAANVTISAFPAADRLVPLNHNSLEYLEVARGLEELREAVRGANDLSDRESVIATLSAAQALWKATELKIIQIKIGVVMAVEEAGRALAETAKAVTTAILIDAIKSLVKSKTGVDLDHL